jgi:hypothetical protein
MENEMRKHIDTFKNFCLNENIELLDKKQKRLSDDKYLNMYFTGTLLQDLRNWLKKGDKVYFKFHKQKVYGTGMYFSLFNEYTHKANISITKLYEYVSDVKRVSEEEYYKVYNEMNEKDYDTYSL